MCEQISEPGGNPCGNGENVRNSTKTVNEAQNQSQDPGAMKHWH